MVFKNLFEAHNAACDAPVGVDHEGSLFLGSLLVCVSHIKLGRGAKTKATKYNL